jgi:SAM-dependent methyltransferase
MWNSADRAEPGREISATHASELDRLGLDYWWLAVRAAHVESALRRVPAPFRYLDFGCGAGTLTARLIQRFGPREALGLDGTEVLLRAARARGVPARRADFREPLDMPFAPDVVTSLDVLEHLEDPMGALRNLAAVAARGAVLLVTVPATPSLTSRWDEVSGHRCRYTRARLRAELRAGGWCPLRVRYIFAYATPGAWVERRLLRRVREFEFPRVSRATNALLTALGALERRLGSPCPFGTSLFGVARRAEGAATE